MRTVCYVVNLVVVKRGEQPVVTEDIFFGPADEVQKDLEQALKLNGQAKVIHAKDLDTFAMLMAKEQVINQLMNHDLDAIGVFPKWVTGEAKLRFREAPDIMFIVNMKVSIRGTKSPKEAEFKKTTILLPPGVRL